MTLTLIDYEEMASKPIYLDGWYIEEIIETSPLHANISDKDNGGSIARV